MKYAISWTLLSAFTVVGIGSNSWLDYKRLAKRGVQTKGAIIDFQEGKYRLARYRYEVAGDIFQGLTYSSAPNPPTECLAAGHEVAVFYDPLRPHISTLGDPKPIFKNDTIGILIAGFTFPSLIVGRWIFKDHRAKKAKANAASKSALQAG